MSLAVSRAVSLAVRHSGALSVSRAAQLLPGPKSCNKRTLLCSSKCCWRCFRLGRKPQICISYNILHIYIYILYYYIICCVYLYITTHHRGANIMADLLLVRCEVLRNTTCSAKQDDKRMQQQHTLGSKNVLLRAVSMAYDLVYIGLSMSIVIMVTSPGFRILRRFWACFRVACLLLYLPVSPPDNFDKWSGINPWAKGLLDGGNFCCSLGCVLFANCFDSHSLPAEDDTAVGQQSKQCTWFTSKNEAFW